MKKQTIYIILMLSLSISKVSVGQELNMRAKDSLQILSMKAQLTTVKGAAKIDLLNKITREYRYFSIIHNRRIIDSSIKYNQLAKIETEKLNYPYGKAMVLLEEIMTKEYEIAGFPEAEKNIQQAILIGNNLKNYTLLGEAYYVLSEFNQQKRLPYLETLKTSLNYFNQTSNAVGKAFISSWLCDDLSSGGKYEEAISYCEKCIVESERNKEILNSNGYVYLNYAFAGLADVFESAGDFETAIQYLQKARPYAAAVGRGWNLESQIGKLYNRLGKYDSALYYFDEYLKINPDDPNVKMLYGETYRLQGKADKALNHFLKYKDSIPSRLYLIMQRHLAKAYIATGDYASAFRHAKRSYFPSITGNFDLLSETYEIHYKIYQGLGKYDSAFKYLQKFTQLKDSVTDKQFYWRINNKLNEQKKVSEISLLQKDILIKEQRLREQELIKLQKEAEIALLAKDNELRMQELKQQILLKDQKDIRIGLLAKDNKLLDQDNQIKKQQLKEAGLIKNLMGIVLLGILLIGFFIFRLLSVKRKNERMARERLENELKLQQLESEKKHAELQQQAIGLEMQALRAQMNPHFIFNCLSSINNYIIQNETDAASDYLTRFSRLIRMVLVNSQKSLVTLEDELEMLKLYLEMEKLRFNNTFNYYISYSNQFETASVFIPPLLLQPFCENAIWHGLMNKKGIGQLDIGLHLEGDVLNCTIRDNGVGRKKAAELNSKSAEREKSLGLKITNNRLAIFNEDGNSDNHFTMKDVINEKGEVNGTEVTIRIRYKELLDIAV